jgi:guanine nucleotide-binding protein subunit alpha
MPDRSSRTVGASTQIGNVWPPPPSANETESEKACRLEKEIEALKVSDAIDQTIDLDKLERRRHKAATKIVLLGELFCSKILYVDTIKFVGQAESGKSTILKNFQLLFAPKSFHAEVGAWKAVIHLNLVRSVNFVLDVLQDPSPSRPPSSAGLPRSPNGQPNSNQLANDLRFLTMRLAPLRQVEHMLTRRFHPPEIGINLPGQYHRDRASEVSVRGLSGWKTLLRHRRNSHNHAASDDLEDSQRVIEACKDDMTLLWESPVVQARLKKHNVRLQDQPGLSVYFVHLSVMRNLSSWQYSFLSDVSRIASKDYMPTSGELA